MLYDWSMDSNHSTIIFVNSGNKNERVPNPARIPPQTSPAGGKSPEAGRIHSPRQIVSPCRVHFNHLDFARNSFELCPTNTAMILWSKATHAAGGCACEDPTSIERLPRRVMPRYTRTGQMGGE